MEELEKIQVRNRRVELDKAWETSWVRRGAIAVITYGTASAWLIIIENNQPFLNALVPCGGYLLSTLSLPVVKRWWVSKYAGSL